MCTLHDVYIIVPAEYAQVNFIEILQLKIINFQLQK